MEPEDELSDGGLGLDQFCYSSASYDPEQRYRALVRSKTQPYFSDNIDPSYLSKHDIFRKNCTKPSDPFPHGNRPKTYDDKYPRPVNNPKDATDWALDKVGDLVDELRIYWPVSFNYIRNLYDFWALAPRHSERSRYILRLTRNIALRRLKLEAERIAPLFKYLAVDFPHLTRLALCIPAALYPDTDELFVSNVLPGHGWTVQHSGSGGGYKGLAPLSAWEIEDDDEFEPNKDGLFDHFTSAEYELERNALIEFDIRRSPLIHRVFTRTSTEAIEAANRRPFDSEWHTTTRPEIDVQDPNIMELIQRCDRR